MAAGKSVLREAFGISFWIFAALALAIGVLVYLRFGVGTLTAAFGRDIALASRILPNVGAGLCIASFVPLLLPADIFGRLMGKGSGMKGVAVATAAGALTPGGPMTSFPLVVVLRRGGTGPAPLVSYITAWSTMGLQRIFVWEAPLMGMHFAIIRLLSSAPLAVIAGLISARLPIPVEDDSAGRPETERAP